MKRYGVAAGLLLALALVSSGSSARDAFPGSNGRIAFLSAGGLFVMNADGSHQDRLLRASGVDPAWSPDGRRLVVNVVGTPPVRVDPEFVNSLVGGPSWSPDGRRLVGMTGSNGDEVDVVDLDSGVQRRIYWDQGMGYPTLFNPAWSPDGRLIAFNDEAGGIIFYDVAHHRLGRGYVRGWGIEGQDPAWSPDGRQLAVGTFTGTYLPGPSPKSSAVFTVRSDGTQVRRIARNASQPAWSPDGRKIVFVRLVARGNSEIFVMNADGTHQRRLTFNPGTDFAPDWQPLPRRALDAQSARKSL